MNSRRTNPLAHFLRNGLSKGLVPTADFDSDWYANEYPDVRTSGMAPFEHYVKLGLKQGRKRSPFLSNSIAGNDEGVKPRASDALSYNQLMQKRFMSLSPLDLFHVPGKMPRINLVTDSVSKGSLFGGVGTAIGLAGHLAKSRSAKLRIVTRTQVPDPHSVYKVLNIYGVEYDNVELFQSTLYEPKAMPVGDDDIFITSSWWSTAATIRYVNSKRVLYLIQEDERMFYPFGDDRLLCEEILKNADINFVVNTKLLRDHFIDSGLLHFKGNSVCFEPAFPEELFSRERHAIGPGKQNLLFYARPNNLRNLFFRGLEAIERALNQGVLDPTEWDISFVGRDIPDLTFSCGIKPNRLENLEWDKYAALVRSIDLGLCLMDTPHPSVVSRAKDYS